MRSLRSMRGGEGQEGAPAPAKGASGAWYADPFGTAAERWWDGHGWTQQVRGTPPTPAANDTTSPRRLEASLEHSALGEREAVPASEGSRVCRRCHGSGRIVDRYRSSMISGNGITCPDCLGEGRLSREERHAMWFLKVIGAAVAITLIVLQVTGVLPAW